MMSEDSRAPGNVGNTRSRGNQNNGQGVNNQRKVICYNCREEGHVARQCKEPKRPKDSLWHQDKAMLLQAKEKGAVLDAEAEAFLADVECTVPLAEPLALSTTNMFQVSHEDAYDSDVDDEPNAAAAFMANLSSSSSQINEVRTFNDTIFETVSHSLSPKVPHDEHLDSDDDEVLEDYTIPYDQYLATKDSQDVPTEASPDPPSAIPPSAAYMLNTLSELTTQVEGHRKVNQKQALVNATLTAELDRCKLELARLEHNKVKLENDQVILSRNKQNAELKQETESLKTTLRNKEATIAHLTCETKTVLSEKKTLEDKYLEEIVCLKSANQVATGLLQKFQMPTQTIPMLSKKPMIASSDIHKIGLGFSNPWYGRKAQLSQPALYDGHRLLQPGHARVTVHDSDETLLETEVSRMKMSQKPGHVKPIDYAKLNALYDQFVPQKELSREQAYWLSATDIASLTSDPPKPVTPFVRTSPAKSQVQDQLWYLKAEFSQFDEIIKERTTPRTNYLQGSYEFCYLKKCFDEAIIPFYNNIKQGFQNLHTNLCNEVTEFKRTFDELDTEYEHNLLEKKNLKIEKKNLMIVNECLISDSIAKDICSIVLASVNVVPPISDCMCAELRSSCDREHNRVLELEAEILKKQQMINDLEQRSAFIQNDHVKLQDQLQGRDETIRNLHAQINIMSMLNIDSPVGSFDKNALETEISQLKDNISSLRIQNDGYKIEIVKQNRWYLELSKASTHSRNTSTEKLAALHDEIAKMKPSGCDTKVSGPKTPEKPKVLAPGMYAISSKYIPPPIRADWIPPTLRKKHVTFQEPTRASTRHTIQTAVNNHKKPTVNMIVSTRMKPATGVSKTQSKSDNQKSKVLPTKNVSARRVEDHPRNLNKKKNVNSSLYVKRFGYVSNKNVVCGACDKCLVSFNHDSCLVINVPSMNTMHAKKPQVARPKTTPKYIRKTDITVAPRIVPQWKPTGRQFLLCDIYGPKKSLTPIAKPLELSPSVSSSSPTTVISRFSDCQLRCSRHMTGDRSKLINYVEKFVGTVRFGNDQFATIVGYGDYKMGDTIISRVYYVEGLSHNLFSVGFQGQPVADSIADKIETTTTYGKFKSTSEAHQVNTPQRLQDKETSAVYVEKALYGLHQAPRAWYKTLSTYLLEKGFRRGTIDKTLFIKKDKGLQVKQKDDGIFISQDKYVADILKKFDFVTMKTASTPIETNKALLKDEEAEDVDVHLYRSMIRSLMYLTASRPDIMFAVCAYARFQVTPKVSHLHAVKRIFRYLKGQPKLGLWYLGCHICLGCFFMIVIYAELS
ncbi:putative reverse transcriptase domain, ribonuclease H-like domain, aspartic peptidase domain protein [Tanacetum coccineum]|uniref:Reverse transcriptase domain, ribonuclease H-like domain, aspartic peptidase domain protein n=1 Tax=Tanacetum coccineum TaxID=301880 RepID=A0ABQ4XQ27_9ASTR